ncbi:hypothetical protein HETIRDRAFT_417135 [Heterobasidion irregulare TC 32-1]|uniref:Uncharacterized protein n=1 Tax=Heterobasidion irregulare (strain TC 32-1) TaxID=747525 RepID=W4KBB9_HETIT|nr:uncharacterized protein HETIRDRAFT_417135 [Heterobasidion irregulare TC 32-1]ETW83142.1 hypothetical protein HETIRDRAFT_417135 [Heterobasidion irregulare TC 32-1]
MHQVTPLTAYSRNDCIFTEKDPELDGFRGLHAARVVIFFSFKHQQITYPCALVEWFVPVGDKPCSNTGMWIVEPQIGLGGGRITSVIHVDSILRGAHLIDFTDTLDAFAAYYVNKFIDHHANEIAF